MREPHWAVEKAEALLPPNCANRAQYVEAVAQALREVRDLAYHAGISAGEMKVLRNAAEVLRA